MNISEYYKLANDIAKLSELESTDVAQKLRVALDYDDLDDHPSVWVPKVQEILIESFKEYPKSSFSSQILVLYQKGVEMEAGANNTTAVKAGVICCLVGIALGWLLWA